MINVNATVTRDGRWWIIKVPEYDITGQAAHLKDAEAVAQEITALWLDMDEADISATVTRVLDEDIANALAAADAEDERARDLAAHAAKIRSKAVRQLLETGMTQNEAAEMLGVSRQRIAQLAMR